MNKNIHSRPKLYKLKEIGSLGLKNVCITTVVVQINGCISILEGFMSQSFSSLVDQFDMYLPNYWKNALLQYISFLHEIQIHKAILLHMYLQST